LSAKSSGINLQEDKVDIDKLLDTAKTLRPLYGVRDCHTGSNPSINIADPENEVSGEGHKISILYAAGALLGNVEFKITSTCSMNSLETIMDEIPTKIPGVTSPFLFFGMELPSFAWHIEDIAAFSVNYLHFGAPCVQ